MDGFIQQVVTGLTSGCVYASLALALVMIHQATHHVNFAQGEMATFSTFLAWSLMEAGMSYWMAFVATVVISFAAGVLLQRTVIRLFENAPLLNNVVVLMGLLLVINALTGWIFDHTVRPFPSPFRYNDASSSRLISAHQVGSMCVVGVLLVALYIFFRRTPLGLAMRAAALNSTSARLVGIRVSWMLAIGWGMAAAIGAVAGMMIAPVIFLDPNMMGSVLLYGLAAALLGGIDSPLGAVLGGLIVGVAENLLGVYVIGTEMKVVVALALIVGTLILRPRGLLGKKLVSRV